MKQNNFYSANKSSVLWDRFTSLKCGVELHNTECGMISSSATELLISDHISRLESGQSQQKSLLWMEGRQSLAQFINPAKERLMIPAWAALALSSNRETLLTFAAGGGASPRAFSQIIDPTPLTPPPPAPPLRGLQARRCVLSSQSGPLVVRAIDWSITRRWSIC